jgi:alkylhydroperoxidase family enzyme
MTIAIGGYNSMNRWTDGLNIPAEENGNFFKKEGGEDLSRFDSPTSAKFAQAKSLVAPVAKTNGAPLDRPKRDSVEDLKKALQSAASRQPTLPLAGSAPEAWKTTSNPAWVRLLATFAKSGKVRYDGLMACQTKGTLSPRLRAAIAWVAAREDRALYALDAAAKRLKDLGLSEEEIYDLDGAATALEPGDRKALVLVKKLAISPAVVADSDVESLRNAAGGPFSDKQVAEIVHHVCNASFFNRLTEAANLPVGQ